ncbi:hypothetical protein, partial [Longimicrobium sp.]|uniref:hypothetical protein n=1 Tax=Longimicrobium sp. TaxID=2029185 RepID=UPI003B3A2B2E
MQPDGHDPAGGAPAAAQACEILHNISRGRRTVNARGISYRNPPPVARLSFLADRFIAAVRPLCP